MYIIYIYISVYLCVYMICIHVSFALPKFRRFVVPIFLWLLPSQLVCIIWFALGTLEFIDWFLDSLRFIAQSRENGDSSLNWLHEWIFRRYGLIGCYVRHSWAVRLAASSFNASAVSLRKSRHWNSALCLTWLSRSFHVCGVQFDVAFWLQSVIKLMVD